MVPKKIDIEKYFNEIVELRKLSWSTLKNKSQNILISDTLDKYPNTIHWGLFDGNKLIASCRISILNNINNLPYPEVFQNLSIIKNKQFVFYSRLVIHPGYRNLGLSNILDEVRIEEVKKRKIKYIIATARNIRLNKLQEKGWQFLEDVEENTYKKYNLGPTSLILYSND